MSARAVVLLHGIWMPGAEMFLLKRRLERSRTFRCHIYSYPSVKATLQENADGLYEFVRNLYADEVNIVGHSLGGVVALRMLAIHAGAPAGRVVCLGSPLCGSRAARKLLATGWGSAMIGRTLAAGVVQEPAVSWADHVLALREVGIIAGTVPVGMGRIVTRFDGANDGTVAVSETRLPGARDHLCVPVNHTALVTSSKVAAQVFAFLQAGRFASAAEGQ